jgi:hypothetical protein
MNVASLAPFPQPPLPTTTHTATIHHHFTIAASAFVRFYIFLHSLPFFLPSFGWCVPSFRSFLHSLPSFLFFPFIPSLPSFLPSFLRLLPRHPASPCGTGAEGGQEGFEVSLYLHIFVFVFIFMHSAMCDDNTNILTTISQLRWAVGHLQEGAFISMPFH